MTDEQIIKVLERCFTRGFDESDCYECPFYTATAKCTEDLRDSVIDLINRQKEKIKEFDEKIVIQQGMVDYQKAELERLKKRNTLLLKKKCKDINTARKIIKSEAIKDFAKRLKRYSFADNLSLNGKETVYVEDIDNLVKEMEEEA